MNIHQSYQILVQQVSSCLEHTTFSWCVSTTFHNYILLFYCFSLMKANKFLYREFKVGSYSHPSSYKNNYSITSHTIYTCQLYETISSFDMASMLLHFQHCWLIPAIEHACKRQDIYIHSLGGAQTRNLRLIRPML